MSIVEYLNILQNSLQIFLFYCLFACLGFLNYNQNIALSCVHNFYNLCVEYFDQRLVAEHPKCWSKSSFSAFLCYLVSIGGRDKSVFSVQFKTPNNQKICNLRKPANILQRLSDFSMLHLICVLLYNSPFLSFMIPPNLPLIP